MAHLPASPRARLNTTEDEAITEEAFTSELEVLAAIGSHLDDEEELQKELQEEACGGTEKPGDEWDDDDFSTICGGADGDDTNSKFGTPLPFKLAYGDMPSSSFTAHSCGGGSSRSLLLHDFSLPFIFSISHGG